MPHTVQRCPICFHAGWHDRGAWRDCTHCELAVATGVPLDAVRDQIAAALPCCGRGSAEGNGWRLSDVALRNAAWALGRTWRETGWRSETTMPHAVTLGVIGRSTDLPAIIALAATGFGRTIAVLDDQEPPPGWPGQDEPSPHLLVAWRPLAGDFASQRNHLQALAEADQGSAAWMLQLDTDERPSASLLASLGWMVAAADRDGLRSIGLPRCNLVDDTPSALFPDIQYRLNRTGVRFRNVVHERPSVLFGDTTLGLAGVIEHRLDGARVRARSIHYESLHPGAGRPTDEAGLLQPFEAGARLFP